MDVLRLYSSFRPLNLGDTSRLSSASKCRSKEAIVSAPARALTTRRDMVIESTPDTIGLPPLSSAPSPSVTQAVFACPCRASVRLYSVISISLLYFLCLYLRLVRDCQWKRWAKGRHIRPVRHRACRRAMIASTDTIYAYETPAPPALYDPLKRNCMSSGVRDSMALSSPLTVE